MCETLAEKFTGQALDATSGPKPDHDLAAALLAEARTALNLAGGTS